ncbi:response regulator [Nostoc flagelliforme]|uniref:response regulator n=1 Tax=Nostoc flagelliforme TaxID=1306274 RepID=UPI000C2D4744|nr:response regulator [Nostoc flagelliforme]
MSHPSCLKILLIDDCAENRLELCHFLQQDSLYTYRILEFEKATQALEWCQQETPDIILLDFVLPDGDRLKFIQQFRECHSNTQTAVIMLTGQGDEIIAVRGMKSGVQDYVVKDKLTAEVLQGAIHHAVERMYLTRQLEQSREQQQLIAAIALRIRQSFKLEEILRATVTEARQFLKADRVVIYQFQPDMSDSIVAESVLPGWTVALGKQIRDTYLQQGAGRDYRQGKKRAINDIYQAGLTNCHLHLLEQFEVKANLVVPILVKEQLWGLLIAHQCSASRHWQSLELDLLDQLAVQIAIAIQQTSAYQQAQAELAKRQRTEAALKVSEEKLKLTLNFAAIGYWEWNPITNQIFAENAIHCLCSEPSGANLTYEQWLNQVYPEDREWVEQKFRQAIATQTDYVVEYRVAWQDGSIHWVSLKGRGLYDETGQLLRMLGVLIDITERKLSEQERRHAEIPRIELQHLMEQIFEVVLAGYWDWDIPGNQEYLSLTFKQMFGYEDHELPNTAQSWQRLIFPEDLPGVLEIFEQHVQSRGKIPYYNEVRYRHKDGSTVWVICSGCVIEWDQDGNPLRMIGCHIDITQRKQVEEALKESEQRYATLTKAAPVAIFRLDNAGNCIYVNDRWSDLTGKSTQAALGMGWAEAIYPEDRDRILKEWYEAELEQTELFYNEGRHLRPDGSINWFDCYLLRETNASGVIIGYIGTLTDITNRKQAEQELIHNRDLREAIFNESADAIFLVDPQTLLTLDCNRQSVELFEAADKTELLNINGQKLQRRPFTASETDAIIRDMQSKGVWSREIEYVTLQGKIFWGNIAAKPITVAGRTMNLVRITDISEQQAALRDRKLAEAQLRQTNEQLANTNVKLARATRLKDEFLANMSHELRTPLNAILGMSEGLQESVFGSINERQAKAIATIERSGRHLLQLINDILDLSKIESGKLELQLSDVSVRSLCDASLSFVKQMALKKNIHLSIHISENIGSIQVDDRRLRQVLINLLSNAVKFTPEGGSVTLEVRVEEAGEQGSRGAGEAGGVNCALSPLSASSFPKLCFHVTDTGIGIAVEEIGKLFQPFIQLDSSLNRQYSGTGLGLVLVQKILTLHGGTISVSSKFGEGSCFTVRIPYHTSDNLLTRQVTASLPSYSLTAENAQVLIVEDSVAAADQITRYFSEMGMQPIIYPKGEGALEEVLRLQPALVILDLQLPNLSGWDVLNQLKSNPKTKDIPVIIISVVDERSKGLTQGAFEYLIKPITRAQLQGTINKLQHSAHSESPMVLSKAALKPPLILLAEDNQANIDTMSGYLEGRGYHLILANNGQQAIDLVKVQRPDLIVMDIQMPEMDGLEAMRRIRDDRQFVDIPMIALTALAMPGDRETCLAAGANEYLTKPVKLKQLVATIQQLLGK